MSDTKPPVRFLRSSLHIPAVNDRRKLSLWHFHDYVLTEFPPTLQCELQKINQNLCLCSFAQGEAAGGGLRADPESHQPQTGVLTHTNTSDRLTITQTTTVTPPIIIMKLLTCNSHSNFLPLDAGTNRASSPQTRACTEQPWERELRFTAKIRRLPQMTAKRSESYKRKQDFKAVWVERPPPLGLQVKRVVGRRG